MDIRSLAYVRIEATDPDRWLAFCTEVLGMVEAEGMPGNGHTYLKMDEYAYRYCIVPGTLVITARGRHSNDRMVSTYVESPAGFALEYGFDGVQCDWNTYTPTESHRTSTWGHRWNQG